MSSEMNLLCEVVQIETIELQCDRPATVQRLRNISPRLRHRSGLPLFHLNIQMGADIRSQCLRSSAQKGQRHRFHLPVDKTKTSSNNEQHGLRKFQFLILKKRLSVRLAG